LQKMMETVAIFDQEPSELDRPGDDLWTRNAHDVKGAGGGGKRLTITESNPIFGKVKGARYIGNVRGGCKVGTIAIPPKRGRKRKKRSKG